METSYKLSGRLKVNAYKTVACEVQLHVSVLEDDPWASFSKKPKSQAYPLEEYRDGVRLVGELSFDDSAREPMKISSGTGANLSDTVTLEVFYSDEPAVTTRFGIVLLNRSATLSIPGNWNEKKYFWQFIMHGSPGGDGLGLFPEDYTGSNFCKVYVCTDFRGSWPYPVSSVVVAKNVKEAKQILLADLKRLNIPLEGDGEFNFTKLDTSKSRCFILNDGKVA